MEPSFTSDESCHDFFVSQCNVETTQRPTRNAAKKAEEKIKRIREWENASEQSNLFKSIADSFEREFSEENKKIKKQKKIHEKASSNGNEDSNETSEYYDSNNSENDDVSDENSEESQGVMSNDSFVVSDSDSCNSSTTWNMCEKECSSEDSSIEVHEDDCDSSDDIENDESDNVKESHDQDK